jgi:dihydroneopterin aldolase/2-amino-4-hydroxy-6-hydroxymethyldihydropteridine diphosphokinase/dihydropteroate synthase
MSGLGVNYSAVTKAIYAVLADPSRTWGSPAEILRAAGTIPLELDAVESVDVEVEMPRALLHAQSAVYGAKFSRGQERGEGWTVKIRGLGVVRGLGVACVVGLHPHEMGERQRLEVDLEVKGWNEDEQESFLHKELADEALRVSPGLHLRVVLRCLVAVRVARDAQWDADCGPPRIAARLREAIAEAQHVDRFPSH